MPRAGGGCRWVLGGRSAILLGHWAERDSRGSDPSDEHAVPRHAQALATLALCFALQAAYPGPFFFFDEIDQGESSHWHALPPASAPEAPRAASTCEASQRLARGMHTRDRDRDRLH